MIDGIAIGAIACALALLGEWCLNLVGADVYLHPVFFAGIFVGNVIFHTFLSWRSTSKNDG